MNKTFLIACLLGAAGQATAGWTLLQETHDGILYVDRDGAEKTSNGWRVDSSQDFHKQQSYDGKEYLSEKSRYEVDCGAKKIRALSVELYPENMAGGELVHTDKKAGEWSVPEKGSRLEAIWQNMCR